MWLANLRRPGALDGHPEWAAALEAIDPDWNPAWPAGWQRHYAAVRELLRDEEGTELLPRVTVGGHVGRWLLRQRQPSVWAGLTDGQRKRLEQLGITPMAREPETPGKGPRGGSDAFERGLAALAQYKARTGSVGPVSRSHIERTVIDGQEQLVKLALEQLGIAPLSLAREAPAKPLKGGSGAFERGVAALVQYKARTGYVRPTGPQRAAGGRHRSAPGGLAQQYAQSAGVVAGCAAPAGGRSRPVRLRFGCFAVGAQFVDVLFGGRSCLRL
ncbi:helicase associated domain-containing protein [Streptomyces sp. NPDC048256]|uniref:helicase associated domain-containing protein n=1 Tax=Streptomyces sp. NPDC048256 TaxID=3154613 RepID=UPI0033C5B256